MSGGGPDRIESVERGMTNPRSRENRGVVKGSPDASPVKLDPLMELATFVPGKAASVDSLGSVIATKKVVNIDHTPTSGYKVTPQAEIPIIPTFYTTRGGGRVGGGGMSTEALRRAKRNSRRHS